MNQTDKKPIYEETSGVFWYPVSVQQVTDREYKEGGELVPNVRKAGSDKKPNTLILFKHQQEARVYMEIMENWRFIYYLVKVDKVRLYRHPRDYPINEIHESYPAMYEAEGGTIPPDKYQILDSARFII